jgi:hypothetical protein
VRGGLGRAHLRDADLRARLSERRHLHRAEHLQVPGRLDWGHLRDAGLRERLPEQWHLHRAEHVHVSGGLGRANLHDVSGGGEYGVYQSGDVLDGVAERRDRA